MGSPISRIITTIILDHLNKYVDHLICSISKKKTVSKEHWIHSTHLTKTFNSLSKMKHTAPYLFQTPSLEPTLPNEIVNPLHRARTHFNKHHRFKSCDACPDLLLKSQNFIDEIILFDKQNFTIKTIFHELTSRYIIIQFIILYNKNVFCNF